MRQLKILLDRNFTIGSVDRRRSEPSSSIWAAASVGCSSPDTRPPISRGFVATCSTSSERAASRSCATLPLTIRSLAGSLRCAWGRSII